MEWGAYSNFSVCVHWHFHSGELSHILLTGCNLVSWNCPTNCVEVWYFIIFFFLHQILRFLLSWKWPIQPYSLNGCKHLWKDLWKMCHRAIFFSSLFFTESSVSSVFIVVHPTTFIWMIATFCIRGSKNGQVALILIFLTQFSVVRILFDSIYHGTSVWIVSKPFSSFLQRSFVW